MATHNCVSIGLAARRAAAVPWRAAPPRRRHTRASPALGCCHQTSRPPSGFRRSPPRTCVSRSGPGQSTRGSRRSSGRAPAPCGNTRWLRRSGRRSRAGIQRPRSWTPTADRHLVRVFWPRRPHRSGAALRDRCRAPDGRRQGSGSVRRPVGTPAPRHPNPSQTSVGPSPGRRARPPACRRARGPFRQPRAPWGNTRPAT